MDYLRSGYRTHVRPYAGSEDTVSIRWFRCADTAKNFPHEHAYGSLYWEGQYDQQFAGPGEFSRQIDFVRGTNPGLKGIHFEGKSEWFLSGIPLAHKDDAPAVCADAWTEALAALTIGDGDDSMFSGCKVRNSGFSLDYDTETVVEFDVEDFDTHSYFAPGSPTFLKPPVEAVYEFKAYLNAALTSTSTVIVRLELRSEDGLENIILGNLRLPGSSGNTVLVGSTILLTDKRWQLVATQLHTPAVALPVEVSFSIVFLGTVVPPVPPTTLLEDTFTDTNGVLLTAHTMDIGPGWTFLNGASYDINSDEARAPSPVGDADMMVAAAESGQADVTVSATVSGNGWGSFHVGVVGRLSDSNNFWAAGIIAGGLDLYEVNAGVKTFRGGVLADSGVPNKVTLQFSGNDIEVFLNDVSVITFSSAFNSTATQCGIWGGRDNGYRWDDFLVNPTP